MVSPYETRVSLIDQRGLEHYKNEPQLKKFTEELERAGYSKDSEKETDLMKRSLLIEMRSLLESYEINKNELAEYLDILARSYRGPLSPLTNSLDEWRKINENLAINTRDDKFRCDLPSKEIFVQGAMKIMIGEDQYILPEIYVIEENLCSNVSFDPNRDIVLKTLFHESKSFDPIDPVRIEAIKHSNQKVVGVHISELENFERITNYRIKFHLARNTYYW